MQDNRRPLEDSQSRLHQDIFNNSFSELEDGNSDSFEEETAHIDISEAQPNSAETLFKQEMTETVQLEIKSETISLCNKQVYRNNGQLHNLTESILKKEEQITEKRNEQTTYKLQDKIQAKHVQKIRILYSRSFLNSQKLSLSQVKKLKSFLFIPKYGEELVRWGNQKFGTQHTVVSALERLQYIQGSQCSEMSVKLKQNLKYLLVLLLCLVTIKVFV